MATYKYMMQGWCHMTDDPLYGTGGKGFQLSLTVEAVDATEADVKMKQALESAMPDFTVTVE